MIHSPTFSIFSTGSTLDCAPYSESVCKEVALKHGLQLGGKNYVFAAPIESGYQIGCYAYKSGSYKGIAFYGRGGDSVEMSTPFNESSDYYRPKGYDCRTESNFYYFLSSMSKKQ